MAKFKKGDRVVCVKHTPGWINPLIGATGTVLEDYSSAYRGSIKIRWDDELPRKGHSCDGLCEDGRGWMLMYHDIRHFYDIPDLGEIPSPSVDSVESLLFGVKS